MLPRHGVSAELHADGTLVLRATQPPVPVRELGLCAFVTRWAAERPLLPAFCERDGEHWRHLRWQEFHTQTRHVASGLIALGLEPGRPIMILSGNSIEQAVLLIAAESIGIPTAPVSPAYSLQPSGLARLRDLSTLVQPQAIFVQAAPEFGAAVEALECRSAPLISVHGPATLSWSELLAAPIQTDRLALASERIRPEHAARIFFTSGSTGKPKGVPLSYRNVQASVGQCLYLHQHVFEEPPVFLDWLPWSHAYGGLAGLARTIALGGSFHIDDGRPTPHQFHQTVRNLREISPSVFSNVPAAWSMLATELERDKTLAMSFFSRLRYCSYGGASMPPDVWERIQRMAEATVGERILLCSGYGSTETSATTAFFDWPGEVGNVGVPVPGAEVKLLPLPGGDGRYEVLTRGPHVFRGYLGQDDLTRAAFDGEGYFRLGDALKLADPADPGAGLRFAGRVVEDFKLASGTWVRTGSVRLALVEQCAPLITDAVICGHDQHFVAALAWPDLAACRALSPELTGLDEQALVRHPTVVEAVRRCLAAAPPRGAAARVERMLLMAEPPSLAANEIAEKGYVNQAAARARRAALVDELFLADPPAHVARAR